MADDTIDDPEILKLLKKIGNINRELNTILIDREKIIELSLISLIAQENILLLGPPGTAKSLLASEICKRIKDASYFQRLLTKFTTDSELFISGQAISEEEVMDNKTKKTVKITRIKSFVEGMLPTCHISFLDEIFKSNSAILNALLTLINEKVYYSNDGQAIPSNLICVFGASNERPRPEDGLDALYDRFLIRYYINYLKGNDFKLLLKLDQQKPIKNMNTISISELKTINSFINEIEISDQIIELIDRKKMMIKEEPELNMINPSDRRMKNSLKLLKAHALLYKRKSVSVSDMNEVYPFILWDTGYGTSNNLKYHTLQILIDYFTKNTSSQIKAFLDFANNIENSKKDYTATADNLRNNIQDKISFSNIYKDYVHKATSFISQIETYEKKAVNFNKNGLPLNEKSWMKRFETELGETKKSIENDLSEFSEIKRSYL